MPFGKAKNAARMRAYRVAKKEGRALLVEHLTTAIAQRGITVEELLDEWVRIGTGEVAEPLTWVAKVKALSEMSARLWPVPRAEPERPVTNNTLALVGYSVEQLRALLGATEDTRALEAAPGAGGDGPVR